MVRSSAILDRRLWLRSIFRCGIGELRAAAFARHNSSKSRPSSNSLSHNAMAGLQRSAELAAESQRLTTLRYKGGEATVLEVVDSQTAFVQASNNYQDGTVRYKVALANLQTLTGV